ncbi:MAG: protein kinase domain-containing protein [Phycisphaeraceae bacterium]
MSEATPNPDPAVTSLTAKAGDKVDNYTIMEQVGAGGTAIVFRGHDHVLNRDVAIKQIVVTEGEAGEDIRQRALAEAQIHKRVAASDPKLLVQYIDTVNDPRGLFLITEYVDGPSLEWMLQQDNQPMDQRQALGIIAATAKALDALHQGGVVHRDLKPSNILMPREGGLKLADFGLAAIVAEQQTLDIGSVRYMSPELLQGEPATAKSDLYSLGLVAYEMLAGRENFNNAFRTILRDQRNQSMRWVKWHTNIRAKVTPLDQLVDDVPASLSELVARMMEKDPARRVGSSAELIEAIRTHFAQAGQDQPAAPGPHAALASPNIDDASQTAAVPQRSKLPMILAGTLVIWLLAIGGFFIWQNKERENDLARRTAALIDAIEAADVQISELQYEAAIESFTNIPSEHASMFDPNERRGRDDLVEAGSLKAQALLAAQNDDYIAAHEKAMAYQKLMQRSKSLPSGIRTNLSLRNAKDLEEEYEKRSAFQQRMNDIEAMFAAGQLDEAIVAIRELKNDTSTNTAEKDLAKLNAFEERYKLLLADERLANLLAEGRRLQAAGDYQAALDLLGAEIEDAGEDVDPRIVALNTTLNRLVQIEDREEALREAEAEGSLSEILLAMRGVQELQPTQGMKQRIAVIEIQILLEEAREARNDGNADRAETILGQVLERSPQNPEAERMLASLKDARMKIEAEKVGDQYLAEGNYKDAIKQYKLALTFGPDTTGSINAKIKDATGRLRLGESETALDAGDVTRAQELLDEAKLELGDTDAIAALQVRIDDLRDYTLLVAEGDALFAREDFGRAKPKYLAAKKIFDSEAINQKVRDCDFGIWLSECDRAIMQRDWPAAESALNRAEAIKINDQTRARRAQINNRVQ